MNVQKIFVSLIITIFASSCSFSESKLESILDKQIGKAQLIEKTRLELDAMLGKQDSKLKSSVLSFLSDRVVIKYTDIIIDGRKARVNVVAVVPKMDEVGTILLLASFLPREKMLKMSIQDVLAEISKNSRRPASEDDIKNETYEFSVDFEKDKDWFADSEQLKKAYTKKNLISKR
ncbi:MAG: hypothetical protein ABL930_01625 [Pseudobdellovibrio sp.]